MKRLILFAILAVVSACGTSPQFSSGKGTPVGSAWHCQSTTFDISVDADHADEAFLMGGFNLLMVNVDGWTAADFEILCNDAPSGVLDRDTGKLTAYTLADWDALTQDDGTVVEIGSANMAANTWFSFTGANAASIAACPWILFKSSTDQLSADREVRFCVKG